MTGHLMKRAATLRTVMDFHRRPLLYLFSLLVPGAAKIEGPDSPSYVYHSYRAQ